jgi:hypothetical protein
VEGAHSLLEAPLKPNALAKSFSAYRNYKSAPSGPTGLLLFLAVIDRQHDGRVRSACWPRKTSRLCGLVSSTNQQIFQLGIGTGGLLGRAALHNDTHRVIHLTRCSA